MENRNIIIGLLVVVIIVLAFLAFRPMMYGPGYSPGGYYAPETAPSGGPRAGRLTALGYSLLPALTSPGEPARVHRLGLACFG